jgi:hypothetical protein
MLIMVVTVAAAGETRDWACKLLFLALFGYGGFHGAGGDVLAGVVGRLQQCDAHGPGCCVSGLGWSQLSLSQLALPFPFQKKHVTIFVLCLSQSNSTDANLSIKKNTYANHGLLRGLSKLRIQ